MKKLGILNSDISRVLAYLRHTDLICISDCGLPVPDNVEVIDLAIKEDLPTFLQVLDAILEDYKCEKYFLATEIKDNNVFIDNKIKSRLRDQPVEYISHIDFKAKVKDCKVVIRTGEMTPYSNIILQSACIF
ncbi:MAG: D-ribose pyranase [Pleomorphochaeta sp.]|jgi:D-ribose pyranase